MNIFPRTAFFNFRLAWALICDLIWRKPEWFARICFQISIKYQYMLLSVADITSRLTDFIIPERVI